MLNKLEQKIRKAIPELETIEKLNIMIQANELRQGNKLLFLGDVVTFKNITEIREDGIFWIKKFEQKMEYKNFHFKPIPLTEELLLKCGFVKDFEYLEILKDNEFFISYNVFKK